MKKLLEKKVLSEDQLLKILGSGVSSSSEVDAVASDRPVMSTSTNPRQSGQDSAWVCSTCNIC